MESLDCVCLIQDSATLIVSQDTATGVEMMTTPYEPPFATGFDVCPPGYILALESADSSGARRGSCTRCGISQYSVSPLAGPTSGSPSCFNCPPSAECKGGDEITFSRGRWVIANGMYMLVGCPRGYQLVNSIGGVFSHDVQVVFHFLVFKFAFSNG